MNYTAEEKKILKNYFTNVDKNVFALTNLPEVIKGTLFSRYSRTAKDVRRLFLDEFLAEKELANLFSEEKKSKGAIDLAKAENFYERILVGYGDDSVAELGGTHVAIENLSMLATKSIEEHRIGLSPLEKSTRYVYYDKKVNGEYMYYKDEKIMNSKFAAEYERVNVLLFDTYSKIVRDIQPTLKSIYPGDENDTAYKFSIRAKACDIARNLLPLSALTNMGVYGNGRAFEYLLITLLNDPTQEVKNIANELNDNLRQVIPAFVKRATNERGNVYRKYLTEVEEGIKKSLPKVKDEAKVYNDASVKLVEYDKKTVQKIVAALLYQTTSLEYRKALRMAEEMTEKEQEKLLRAMGTPRQNRHHKLVRATEEAYFGFEIVADWGVYKDLMRHRILTRHRKLFTNELGYAIPYEIDACGFGKIYREAMDAAVNLYKKLKKQFPHEAQYIVTHGAYNSFYLKLNVRAATHMTELRSIPQGHPTYRKVAQLMTKEIEKKMPLVAKYLFGFVDFKDYELERLSAFKNIASKAEKMGIKAFQD